MRISTIFLLLAIACSHGRQETSLSQKQSESAITYEKSILEEEEKESLKKSSTPIALSPALEMKNILGKIEVLVPNEFRIMDAEIIAVKYPLKQHAMFYVYTNEETNVNIAFEHTQDKATFQDIPAIKQVFEYQFSQAGIDLRKSEIKKINGRDFALIEMITPALDTEVYNLMFFTSLENRLLIGTFNCTTDEQSKWKPLAEEIVNSVRIKD